MPHFLKKYFISAVAAAVCAALAVGVCLYGLSVTVSAASDITVVLDAGHGGIDGGVSGKITGTPESEINLAIVKRLETYLERAGVNCVLTRKTDAGLYGVLSKGFKKRDMAARKEIIEKAKPAAVVSIHQNFYSSASQRGGQAFYSKDNENSRLLACAVQKWLNDVYGDVVKDRKALSGDYFMLNCTGYASVIAECGFLSNAEDEALLISEGFRDEVAYAIFTGIIEYLSVPSAG